MGRCGSSVCGDEASMKTPERFCSVNRTSGDGAPNRSRAGCFSAEEQLRRAFTRVDLLAVVAVLAFAGIWVLPALAQSRVRSDRVICANNLRQIGLALHVWGNDHDDLFPLELPVASGGTRGHPL